MPLQQNLTTYLHKMSDRHRHRHFIEKSKYWKQYFRYKTTCKTTSFKPIRL